MSTSFSFVVTDGAVTAPAPATRKSATLVDVLLINTEDGGEIQFLNGIATMTDGLANAAYLSLFGGNEQDSGLQGTASKQWWGNLGETLPERRYRSETQFLLNTLPAITANLLLIQDAVGRDLAWMRDTGLASDLSALVTMPGLNRINAELNIEIGDQRYELVFSALWGA